MKSIIENNYVVIKYFDNHFDGYASKKYLSKLEADKICKNKQRNYLTSFKVIEHLSIVGIVPFNQHKAYIFNREPDMKSNNKIQITGGGYEDLMNCYVFHRCEIDKEEGEILEREYYERGGKLFDKYHAFEDEILRPERKLRQCNFRNEIVEHIFKHNFQEVGKNKWKNIEGVIIKEVSTQCSSSKYPYYKSYIDIANLELSKKMLIGSVFSEYLKDINQLSEKKFNIPCNKKDRRKYHFTCFELSF